MYASRTAHPDSIRIINFGFAKQLRTENGLLTTPCYTAQFTAPEILENQGCDMSYDVCETLYATDENSTPQKIMKRVGEGKYSLNGPAWANISESAKDLVQLLLHADSSKRLSAAQILTHRWIDALDETYRALTNAAIPIPLKPVNESALARR
ncbi:unnamed protein product [Gongylonema pulchrum]|uniref:Protein kinase domain-containing protein n=1 Tax=Gongylonema pulchrum TaxID=637853 RepID=A0A183EFZ4_9BILA|nr:unnamed protein product [Gongylonema pulchrum]